MALREVCSAATLIALIKAETNYYSDFLNILGDEAPNAFPMELCVLKEALLPQGYFYGKYECLSDTQVRYTDYGNDMNCGTNVSAPVIYDLNTTMTPGDPGYFHCGGETNYQTILTCTDAKQNWDYDLVNGDNGGDVCCQDNTGNVFQQGCFTIYLATEACFHDLNRGLWQRHSCDADSTIQYDYAEGGPAQENCTGTVDWSGTIAESDYCEYVQDAILFYAFTIMDECVVNGSDVIMRNATEEAQLCTAFPTMDPTTPNPTLPTTEPTHSPTVEPTGTTDVPTVNPTLEPTTASPTESPSVDPNGSGCGTYNVFAAVLLALTTMLLF